MTDTNARIFFITGVSTGFGRALAMAALERGHDVVGTVRSEAARAAFAALRPGHAHGVLLDVTDDEEVVNVVRRVEHEIGPIDVLVNNAGYGHEGTIEESSMDDLRRQFAVNVFGAIAVTKAVLPSMRRRRHGHIVNITSMGGIATFPGLGLYHGSKFALEGLSETLGKEVKAFGIAVTAVEPGAFRTDWLGRSMVRAARTIPDYDATYGPIRAAREARNGRQLGDPAKAADAILRLVESPDPPAHLPLGPDAVQSIGDKLGTLQAEMAAWKDVSLATNFS